MAGHDLAAVLAQVGRPYRLNDVLRRTLPAGPPSRLRFTVDLPPHARLDLACAITEKAQDRPGVEFVVKAVRKGREETVWTARYSFKNFVGRILLRILVSAG